MKQFSKFSEEKGTHKTKDGKTAKKGLWYNIHQKRKRGEKPAKPGEKGYPQTLDLGEAAPKIDDKKFAAHMARKEKPKKMSSTQKSLSDISKRANEATEKDQKAMDRYKGMHQDAKAKMNKATSHDDMVKAMNTAQHASKAMKKIKSRNEEKVSEVLDTPKAMDSYKKKAKMQSDKARNSATAKLVRGNDDISKEKNTIRKREKGQDMADRNANRKFRKQMGYDKKKESVEEKKLTPKQIKRALQSIKPSKKKPTLPKAPWDGKEAYIPEKLSVGDGMGAWIDDFKKSDAPQFKGKNEKERRDMAIAAYMSAKRGSKEEGFASAAQRKAVWATYKDGGKGHPDNKKKVKNEAFDFRVNIDGFPEMFMSGNSPGEVKAHLRQLVKQPSMIKGVDRVSKHDKKKELRKKAMGEGTMGSAPEWGTPEATKKAKKVTPGEKDEGFMDTVKKGLSYVWKNNSGSSTDTNRKSTSGKQNSRPSPSGTSLAQKINFGGKYSK